MVVLTKSKYLIGLQCPLYLWTAVNEKEKIPEPDEAAKHKFAEGNVVGELAKRLFPGGIDIPADDFLENIEQTKKFLKEKKPLFEAGFLVNDCFSRADILVPVGDEWDIVEVKMGTKVKDVNVHDVSFQKYVYELCGLKIRKCFLMHLNNEYVRQGELELEKLFVKEDITSEVSEIEGVGERVKKMFEIIRLANSPSVEIGPHCKKPYECPLPCWEVLPENHVFYLYRGGKKSFELFKNGVLKIEDIPDEYDLTRKQGIQKLNKVFIDKEKIKEFLDSLKEPLYYLDFETFSSAIPMFDGLKPYSQVPFQYSLHVDGKHFEYLYNGCDDPRKEFLESLKKVLGDSGSIVVYNQSFEINRLKELAEMYPSYKEWVSDVISRIVDLLTPFRNFHYYNPKQKGSASIKKVLPALTGESYSNLEINNGGDASLKFYKMAYENGEDVRENLLKYCCLDTEGMVWIVRELKELVK